MIRYPFKVGGYEHKVYDEMPTARFVTQTELSLRTGLTLKQVGTACSRLCLKRGLATWKKNSELEPKMKRRMAMYKAQPLDEAIPAEERKFARNTKSGFEKFKPTIEEQQTMDFESFESDTPRSFDTIKSQGDRYSERCFITEDELRFLEEQATWLKKHIPTYADRKNLEISGETIGLKSMGDNSPMDLDENGRPRKQWILNFLSGKLTVHFTAQAKQLTHEKASKLMSGEDTKLSSKELEGMKELRFKKSLELKALDIAIAAEEEHLMHTYHEDKFSVHTH